MDFGFFTETTAKSKYIYQEEATSHSPVHHESFMAHEQWWSLLGRLPVCHEHMNTAPSSLLGAHVLLIAFQTNWNGLANSSLLFLLLISWNHIYCFALEWEMNVLNIFFFYLNIKNIYVLPVLEIWMEISPLEDVEWRKWEGMVEIVKSGAVSHRLISLLFR